MTPTKRCPALRALSNRMRHVAQEGPAAFRNFLASDEFRKRFDSIPPPLRRRTIQAIVEAEAFVRDPLPPPVKAKPMGDGKRRNWRDPAQVAKLAKVYAVCGDDHEKAGRMLRVTTATARLAKKRYLDVAATPMAQAA